MLPTNTSSKLSENHSRNTTNPYKRNYLSKYQSNESTTGADASVKVQDMKLLDLASLAVADAGGSLGPIFVEEF